MKLPVFSRKSGDDTGEQFLVVGLGNPGEEYAHTRHNIGFKAVKRFFDACELGKKRRRYGGQWREGDIDGVTVATLLPQTFMNRSGEAVLEAASRKHIPPRRIIVVHDDMDYPLGTVRVRQGGGSGGHRGLDSITRKLGSPDYTRVRIGIGRPDDPAIDARDWVLTPFTEQEDIGTAVETAAEGIKAIILEGAEAAMNRFNRREVK